MYQPIKLAVVGGSSTGKTTLVKLLENKFKDNSNVVFVHESARQFFADNPEQINFTLDVQKKILDLVFENEKRAMAQNPKLIITDTSALEVMFYTKVHGDSLGAEYLYKRLKGYIPTYSKFLILNPEDVRFENDEIRIESKETRDKIHRLMIDFYHKEHLPFEMISGTIPERVKRIKDIIDCYL